MKKIMCVIYLLISLHTGVVLADPYQSNSSEVSLLSTVYVVTSGTVAMLKKISELTVASVKTSGKVVIFVLEGVSDTVVFTIQVTTRLSGETSIFVGDSIQVSAEAGGYLLIKAGQVIAFIPQQVGKSLIYHAPHQGK